MVIRYRQSEASNLFNRALAIKDQGDVRRALFLARKAVKNDPSNPRLHSGLLYMLYFLPGMTQRQLVDEHRQWASRHAEAFKSTWRSHPNSPGPRRPLRIGYVSPDLRIHPIGRFMLPLFVEHDREQLEIYCYSATRSPDGLSEKIKLQATAWRDIHALSDDEAAELIGRDGIDILVDLSMHMGDNRLGIFARKPAPVQATYLAYAGTTGLEAIDFRITDPYLDPVAESGADFCEKPIRLPSYWCYKPSILQTDPVAPPSIKNRFITFGSLNNFCKVNAAVRETWIELLRALPSSRLILHAHEGIHRQELRDSFAAGDVAEDRITFIELLNLADYTRQYQQIDIALDTFPYAGGTTTCDALWMGVPVITLRGDLAVSRSGVSILSTVGLTELIAQSRDEYVRLATSLALDAGRLANLHATIRQRLTTSRLTDARVFARDMETAYRQMWIVASKNITGPDKNRTDSVRN